jgi:hypothetical protein
VPGQKPADPTWTTEELNLVLRGKKYASDGLSSSIVVRNVEMLVPVYQTTRRHVPFLTTLSLFCKEKT